MAVLQLFPRLNHCQIVTSFVLPTIGTYYAGFLTQCLLLVVLQIFLIYQDALKFYLILKFQKYNHSDSYKYL
ncbi:unnamed protein product [Thlaspi arvense]|uniref:Uncharacterized protein n=1 Tax=Thlaspi arvense TaxID=13288 RepID=A0AAU9SGP5_THLAR|nr:unnamed protein product [Thlaspi arvense]